MTVEQIKANSDISTAEVRQDIIDTQNEIDGFLAELAPLMFNPHRNRVAIYMREGWILKRESFIKKLETILEYRDKGGIDGKS